MVDAPAPFSIQACGPQDRAEQLELYRACFKKPLELAGLRWRYDDNPAGQAVSLLCRPAGGRGVSGYACSPRRALALGDESSQALVGETGDVMTHPDWRQRGLFSDLDRAAREETARRGWPLMFGLPNQRSAHIFLELGWERVGSVRSYTLILAADATARERRLREGRLRALLTPLGARKGRSALERLTAAAAAFDTRRLQSVPPEVGELSREVEARFAFMLRRDAEALTWRFLRAPAGLHRLHGAFDAEGRLAAYAVVQRPREGQAVGYLVDALGRDDGALEAAVGAGLRDLAAAGVSLVEATAIDGSWWCERLTGFGFLAPRDDNHMAVILYVHDLEHPLAKAARNPSGWYFTDGDRDDETMG